MKNPDTILLSGVQKIISLVLLLSYKLNIIIQQRQNLIIFEKNNNFLSYEYNGHNRLTLNQL